MNDVVLHMQLEDGNNTSVADLVRCVIELDELALPEYSKSIFTLWMSSGLLGMYKTFNYVVEHHISKPKANSNRRALRKRRLKTPQINQNRILRYF